MPRKRANKRKQVGRGQGSNLVVIAGLPRDSLGWIKSKLARDTAQKPALYVGAPASPNDWRNFYKKNYIAETLELIERESSSLSPHRVIVLYVPSRDKETLISALAPVCFLAPLIPEDNDIASDGNLVGWRHKKPSVERIIRKTMRYALNATNALKAEITDKRISAFTLPAHNFCYPNRHSTISSVYQGLSQSTFSVKDMKDTLQPTRFTRDQLPQKAFKGKQHTDTFFQDSRGMVFPPDLFHAPTRSNEKAILTDKLSLGLQQRYRFGVTVRDGNLHYDVQYERPRTLRREAMRCSVKGAVLVTGSHANVGVNDVIWAPDGKIEMQK